MRKFFTFLLLAAFAAACAPAPSFPEGASLYELESGKALSARKASREAGVFGTLEMDLSGAPQAVSFVRVNPAVYGVDILTGEGQAADSTSALCLRHGAVAGINGSYFDMETLTPVTYVKNDGFDEGVPLESEFFRVNGSIFSGLEGVRIDALDSLSMADTFREALSAGPILLDEGEEYHYPEDTPGYEDFYRKRHPRSVVGTDADGYLWLVAVDGRAPGRAEGMSIGELTGLCRLLGLTDALNLDGGGSTTLWTLSSGVLNHPSDNRLFDSAGERIVPNVISLKKISGR